MICLTASEVSSGCDVDIVKVSAIALVGLVSLLVLKQFRPEWATVIRLGTTAVLVGFLLSMVTTVVDFAGEIGSESALLPAGMWQILLKSLGVTLITEVAAGICRDSGEAGVAMWVEMAGKLEIIILSLPLVTEILLTVRELLSIS